MVEVSMKALAIELRQRILAELSRAEPPYAKRIGGAYLDKAWREGADFIAHRCIALIEEKDGRSD